MLVALGLSLALAYAVCSDEPTERIVTDPDAIWVRHTISKGETIGELALRYGVTLQRLAADNGPLDEIGRGDVLLVNPDQFVPPRQRRFVTNAKERSWDDMAAHVGVTVDELRRWNPKLAKAKRVGKGVRLAVWEASRIAHWPAATVGEDMPEFEVRQSALSIGKPHRGRLKDGLKLPESDDYVIRFERLCYGTSVAVGAIRSAIAAFRRDTGFDADIFIGAMSRKVGRRLRPHRSHQSGRDVDVRLPAMPYASGYKLTSEEVDWHATWSLAHAFVRTGVVKVIFLERKFHERVRRAGMRLGATDAELADVMAALHHSKGHTSHMHVRFVCRDAAADCVEAK